MHGEPVRIQLGEGLAGESAPAAEAWDALAHACAPDDPFLEHAFLHALETSRSVGPGTGWQPCFLLAFRGDRLCGAVPLYRKSHSYGEFVFDWGWAGASERAGVPYYPKLVAAIPFTPATGPRLLVAPGPERDEIAVALARTLPEAARHLDASSVHVLFCTPEESRLLAEHGFAPRLGYQYHWHNRRPQPYRDFEDFLAAFRSAARKQARRERERARAHGLELVTRAGPELTRAEWQALHRFYLHTVTEHGSQPYLGPAFFAALPERLADRVVATLALREGVPVAGTLNFRRGRVLYGRYWGADEHLDHLHFELCYHRLVEHAIAHGLERVEAGAQGEHKLKRGFLPALTHSAHWLRHPGLAAAVHDFLEHERPAVKAHVARTAAQGPFGRSA